MKCEAARQNSQGKDYEIVIRARLQPEIASNLLSFLSRWNSGTWRPCRGGATDLKVNYEKLGSGALLDPMSKTVRPLANSLTTRMLALALKVREFRGNEGHQQTRAECKALHLCTSHHFSNPD